MGIFRQWLEAIEKQINPPAIVRKHVDPAQMRKQVQILQNITQSVVKGLTGLLDFGQIKTEASDRDFSLTRPRSKVKSIGSVSSWPLRSSDVPSSYSLDLDTSGLHTPASSEKPVSPLPPSPSSISPFDFSSISDPSSTPSGRYSPARSAWEKRIFGKGCHELCEFVRKYVPGYDGEKPENSKCGTEGCAYFLDGIVMKATTGEEEFKIAEKLKGKDKIVPVIDTMAFRGAYFILMHKTVTDFGQGMRQDIAAAGGNIRVYFDRILKMKYDLKRHLNVEEFRKFWEARIQKETWRSEISETAEKLFSIITGIYKETGYLISHDVHPGNVGLRGDDYEPQMFDLGYPRTPESIRPSYGSSKSGTLGSHLLAHPFS